MAALLVCCDASRRKCALTSNHQLRVTKKLICHGFDCLKARYDIESDSMAPRHLQHVSVSPFMRRILGSGNHLKSSSRRQQTRLLSSQLLKVSEEVANAIKLKKPVVALESAIYTHGKMNSALLQWLGLEFWYARLSLSRECRFGIPSRICDSCQRWNPSHYRYSAWGSTCWA